MLVLRVGEVTLEHREDFLEELGLNVGYLLRREPIVNFPFSYNFLVVDVLYWRCLIIELGGFPGILVKIDCLYRFWLS